MQYRKIETGLRTKHFFPLRFDRKTGINYQNFKLSTYLFNRGIFFTHYTRFSWFVFCSTQPPGHFFSKQSGISNVLIDGVCCHFGNILRSLCFYIQCYQAICNQIVDWFESFLPNKVLPIIEQPIVQGLIAKSENTRKKRGRAERYRGKSENSYWQNTQKVTLLASLCLHYILNMHVAATGPLWRD